MLFHIDAIAKKPKFSVADLKVGEMGSGDVHNR
jgi:hypothetical protein